MQGMHHLGQMFAAVAESRGRAPAITTSGACFTYDELLSAARAVSRSLTASGAFRPSDRVVLLLPNSAEYVAGFYGVLLAGGVAVPVSPRTEAGALGKIVESTAAVAVVAEALASKSRPQLGALLQVTVQFAGGAAITGESHDFPADGRGDGLAAIFFTGGSTGAPRGVMLSHRNLIANAQSIQQYQRITSGDRPLCVLPFLHAFGNSVLQSHVLAGAHLILDGQTSFPETLIAALARHSCTSLSGVPDLFRLLLERSSLGQTRLPALRYAAVAGGELPLELARQTARRIAPAEFFVMYGQTEATARLAYLPPAMLGALPAASIGRAIPGVTLEIVDESDRPVEPGAVGELRARGDNVMLGYWCDPAATAERIRGGWLYTGDRASQTAGGWISLEGRRSSIVKIAGFRVLPGELEDFAVRRLEVIQAVAVPFETAARGTRLALYVRPASAGRELSTSEMIARCRAELPRHLVPELIDVVGEFPLNDALKIDRPLLIRRAEVSAARRRRALA